jgi:predicted RNA binding protein YcfA (HicA-like mRNA interferase family)
VVVRQKGSHIVLKGSYRMLKRTVVVPRHAEIAVGTLKGILSQAGLSSEEFLELVKKS